MNRLLKWLFPLRAVCMGCNSMAGCREDWVCPECRKKLAKSWVGAYPPPEGIDGAAFAYVYRDPAARIVRRLKYGGIARLADFMADDMCRAYSFIEPTGADCVTCTPMHEKRLRRRGYNHAELLARALATRLNLEFVDTLYCTRLVKQQARLDGEARRQNLRGAIAVKTPVPGRRVILVDDVRTTGATARTCAEALKASGAEQVFLVCYTMARGKEP